MSLLPYNKILQLIYNKIYFKYKIIAICKKPNVCIADLRYRNDTIYMSICVQKKGEIFNRNEEKTQFILIMS